MRLKVKMLSIVVTIVSCLAVVALSMKVSEHYQNRADQALVETKQALAEKLDVEPGELTVYWSGEYRGEDQYRYRYRHSSDSSYAGDVSPRYDDYVISSDFVRERLVKTVNLYRSSETWERIAMLALLGIIGAIVSIPFVVITSLYDRLKQPQSTCD